MSRLRQHSTCILTVLSLVILLAGCVNGPLPSLYYRKQWDDDEKFGPTLYTRLGELKALRDDADSLPEQQQADVARRLNAAVTQDPSSVYRSEAIKTLGALRTPLAAEGLHRALGDDDPRVRMVACDAWARRGDPQALAALSHVLRNDADLDVRMAAARGIERFEGRDAVEALAVALDDPDPALQFRAVESLRQVTDEDFGNSIPAWRQYVRGEPVSEPDPPSIAERFRTLF